MGILNWLRAIAKPWLGPDVPGPAVQELEQERARVRMTAANGKFRFLPYYGNITQETPQMRDEYRLALREPVFKAALLDKVLSVAALDLAVNPGGDGTPRDKLCADFGAHYLSKVKASPYGMVGLPCIVETVIIPGLLDGYSVAERTHYPEERGKWRGKVLLKLKGKDTGPSGSVQLEVDDYNNVTAVVGIGPNSGQRWDPANFVIWRHLSIFDNPAGMSDARACYRAVWTIDTVTKLRAIYLTKFAAGPMLMGSYTDEGTEKSQLEAGLEAAAAATWISIPEGAKVEALNLAMSGTADFSNTIEASQEEIFLSLLGAKLQAMEGTTNNGRGSSEIHKGTANVRKWHIRASVEGIINEQILPDATDLNFAAAAVPVASLGGVDDGEMQTSLAVDVGLRRDLGLTLSKKDLYKRYGRPEPLDAADTLAPAPPAAPGGMFAEPVGGPAVEPFCEHGQRTSWGYTFGDR